jgi:hypothetical protein
METGALPTIAPERRFRPISTAPPRISLMRHSDEVLIGLLTLAGRGEAIVALRLVETRDRLEEVRQLIDVALEGDGERRTSGPS